MRRAYLYYIGVVSGIIISLSSHIEGKVICMYFDISKCLSYGAFLNLLIGSRGVGKTYGLTKFVIKEFLKKGYEFMYVRRYKTEMQKSAPKFFSAMISNEEFKGHDLKVKGSTFPNVKYIIFDEFIIENGQNHYLRGEVDIFLGLIETVARTRDVKVFLLGNAVTTTNPYFLYFNLSLPYNNEIKTFKDGLILVDYMYNLEYMSMKRDNKFGKLVKDTEYEPYAIDNRFKDDNKVFIEKKSGSARCNFSIIYKNYTFGIWYDYLNGKIYVSFDYNKDGLMFACTNNEHNPNTLMLSLAKEYRFMKVFIKNYKAGNVYYENLKIKNLMQEAIRLILKS